MMMAAACLRRFPVISTCCSNLSHRWKGHHQSTLWRVATKWFLNVCWLHFFDSYLMAPLFICHFVLNIIFLNFSVVSLPRMCFFGWIPPWSNAFIILPLVLFFIPFMWTSVIMYLLTNFAQTGNFPVWSVAVVFVFYSYIYVMLVLCPPLVFV